MWLDGRPIGRQIQKDLAEGEVRLVPGVEGRLRISLTRQSWGLTLVGGNKS